MNRLFWLPLAACAALAQAPTTAPAAKLAIVSATLQTQEDGAALPAGRLFRAGELSYGSFFVTGFARKPVGEASLEETELSLTYEVKVVDPEGTPIQKDETGALRDTIRRQDNREGAAWRPKIRFQFLLPPAPPSGTYRVEMKVKDLFANTETTATLPFEVKGYDPPKVAEFSVANLRFHRSDRANDPTVSNPSYRANDTVWVRFDVAGFALGPKNRYDVSLGLAVLDAAGKVLFEQPDATQLAEEPDYPKRGLPGALSITVAPGTAKAEYQFRVTATDRVGNRTTESTGRFQVE